jgi:hypothetical protein
MIDTILDRPTAAELIALLKDMPPDTPVRIEDPDTGWTIHQVHVFMRAEKLWLTGEYCEMNGEETMRPKGAA